MTESIETPAPEAETAEAAVVEVVVPTPAPAATRTAPRGGRPIQTVGRRKEAIVRVRLVPG